MFEDVVLEEIQKDLLSKLVEIERGLPPEKRGKFLVATSMSVNEATIIHTGGPRLTGHMRDIEVLRDYNLINLSYGPKGTPSFYVTPIGFKFYESIKIADEPVGVVENEYRKYMSSDTFREVYSEAYSKWVQSEKLLWGNDSQQNLTTIGHLCREAMQEYTEVLIKKNKLEITDPLKANTVSRLRSVIATHKSRIGDTIYNFLYALIPYWGTVSDLAQRQEHGSEREGGQLTWEDARRLVFQTLVLFIEIDRAINIGSEK